MIKYLIEVTTSKRDLNGNCYHAATITKTENGESIEGTIDAPSNVQMYLRRANVEWNEMRMTESVLPIRQFNAATKGFKRLASMEVSKFLECKSAA